MNNRYPTAQEIDDFEFLPSSRSIQRSFGGLVKTRTELGLELNNYTKGTYRSEKAKEADARARNYEEEFFTFLKQHFHEIAIHEHKVIRPGNVNSDFFVYLNKSNGIVIDLFYANDIRNLLKIVNIKLLRYSLLPFRVFLIVVGNDSISQEEIKSKMTNKHVPLPSHIAVQTEKHFKNTVIPLLKTKSAFTL